MDDDCLMHDRFHSEVVIPCPLLQESNVMDQVGDRPYLWCLILTQYDFPYEADLFNDHQAFYFFLINAMESFTSSVRAIYYKG